MQIIVAGSKGFIGNALILQIIKSRVITHVFSLVRAVQGAPSIAKPHSKVTEISLLKDEFENWPQELIDQFTKVGVQACIWCIGGAPGQFPDLKAAHEANIELPLAAIKALSVVAAPKTRTFSGSARDQPIRFIYLSVSGAERNQNASLWTQIALRKIKGAAEQALFDFHKRFEQEQGEDLLELFALRLGTVLAGGKTTANIIKEAAITSCNVERVAKVCCEVATDGWFDDDGDRRLGGVIENAEVLGPDWADIDKFPIAM
jgi:nucleoside-diphosphate-sugar epimerase